MGYIKQCLKPSAIYALTQHWYRFVISKRAIFFYSDKRDNIDVVMQKLTNMVWLQKKWAYSQPTTQLKTNSKAVRTWWLSTENNAVLPAINHFIQFRFKSVEISNIIRSLLQVNQLFWWLLKLFCDFMRITFW